MKWRQSKETRVRKVCDALVRVRFLREQERILSRKQWVQRCAIFSHQYPFTILDCLYFAERIGRVHQMMVSFDSTAGFCSIALGFRKSEWNSFQSAPHNSISCSCNAHCLNKHGLIKHYLIFIKHLSTIFFGKGCTSVWRSRRHRASGAGHGTASDSEYAHLSCYAAYSMLVRVSAASFVSGLTASQLGGSSQTRIASYLVGLR